LAAKIKQLALKRKLRALLTQGQSPHECGGCNPRLNGDGGMKFFSRFFACCDGSLTTALERQRLGRTMPGETAAIAGTRLGVLVS
jgi:hypothetical protein